MTLVRQPATNFKMTIRADNAVSACNPLPLSINAFAHQFSRGSQPLDTNLPSPQVAGLQNKANFSLHHPCLLSIVFWATSNWAWFSVTKELGGKLERQAQPLPFLLMLGHLVFKPHMWWGGLGVVVAAGGFSRTVKSDSCDPLVGSLPGFSVHEIFQARIMEWVTISFSTVIHIKQINFTKGRRSPVSSVPPSHVSAEVLNSLYSSLIIHDAGQL